MFVVVAGIVIFTFCSTAIDIAMFVTLKQKQYTYKYKYTIYIHQYIYTRHSYTYIMYKWKYIYIHTTPHTPRQMFPPVVQGVPNKNSPIWVVFVQL